MTAAIPATAGSTRAKIRAYLVERFQADGPFVFTIAQLREACQDQISEQFSRRMRELREEGFVIDTYRENPGLKPAERMLVKIP
jgi:hypothetical protein